MSLTLTDLERSVNSGLTTTVKKSEINFDQLFIEVEIENLASTILFLKTNDKCKFKQLIDITAVDYPSKEKRFKMIYLLLSHENNFRIVISAYIEEKTKVPSIIKIFPPGKKPTISELSNKSWVALNVILEEKLVRDFVPDLKNAGAEDIVEYPLNKIIH